MSHHDHKKFKNESQDARRRDKHNATHPEEKFGNPEEKIEQTQVKETKSNKRK
ncbi:hypothetical protein [Legionella maioricensis]|uniref:Uncharacterized protein n=1 Tax=Legionella maioricensis TaxID=2896528 RepID=A0A9X2D001_9GAMM|nr:hypothetical protein [Legionella maioricensis]MCL9683837.1 hypothetical protein [Legionella maioricensis]MCL9686684.1 hypothetical protein [Legionella maioricensis]